MVTDHSSTVRAGFWWVTVSPPVVHEVAGGLPDINATIRVFLVLPDRYS
jgi:hypothetical protein